MSRFPVGLIVSLCGRLLFRRLHLVRFCLVSIVVALTVFMLYISRRKLVNYSDSRKTPYLLPDDFSLQWFLERSEDGRLQLTADDETKLEEHFYSYLSNITGYRCQHTQRVGGYDDGGWDICADEPYNFSSPCLVYSFGIGGSWAFDDEISSDFGCQDMAYDPTIGKSDHQRNDRIWFFNAGLGGRDEASNVHNWTMFTFPSLLKRNNHEQSTIDVLKIDIEFSEWAALETMLAQPECLSRVKQLDLEVHLRDAWQPAVSSAADLIRYWRILHGLHEIGFHAWKLHENPVRSCHYASKRRPWQQNLAACYNIYFVNTKYSENVS